MIHVCSELFYTCRSCLQTRYMILIKDRLRQESLITASHNSAKTLRDKEAWPLRADPAPLFDWRARDCVRRGVDSALVVPPPRFDGRVPLSSLEKLIAVFVMDDASKRALRAEVGVLLSSVSVWLPDYRCPAGERNATERDIAVAAWEKFLSRRVASGIIGVHAATAVIVNGVAELWGLIMEQRNGTRRSNPPQLRINAPSTARERAARCALHTAYYTLHTRPVVFNVF